MPHVCHFTGRKTITGWIKSEKGARRDGGVGNKVKGRTKRKVKPNLKKLRIQAGVFRAVFKPSKVKKAVAPPVAIAR